MEPFYEIILITNIAKYRENLIYLMNVILGLKNVILGLMECNFGSNSKNDRYGFHRSKKTLK